MPSDDEPVAIRLSLSVERKHIGRVSGQSARRPLGLILTRKIVEGMSRRNSRLMQTGDRETLFGFFEQPSWVSSHPTPTETKRPGKPGFSRSRRFVLNVLYD